MPTITGSVEDREQIRESMPATRSISIRASSRSGSTASPKTAFSKARHSASTPATRRCAGSAVPAENSESG